MTRRPPPERKSHRAVAVRPPVPRPSASRTLPVGAPASAGHPQHTHEKHPHHDHAHEDHVHPERAGGMGRPWLRVALWLSLSALALWVLLHGQANRYIAPNVAWTLWVAIIVALALAALDGYAALARGDVPRAALARLRALDLRVGHTWAYGLVFLPVITGILVAPSVLGAGSILANDGVVTLLPAPGGTMTQTLNAGVPSLLQLQDRLRSGAPLLGATVQVVGFAFQQPGLPRGEWLLTRFITPHCVAEAQPIALVVTVGNGERAPPNNTWLRLTGTLTAGTVNGHSAAILVPTVTAAISTPLDPYLIY